MDRALILGVGRLQQGSDHHSRGRKEKAKGRHRRRGDPKIARSVSGATARGTLTWISLKSLFRREIKQLLITD